MKSTTLKNFPTLVYHGVEVHILYACMCQRNFVREHGDDFKASHRLMPCETELSLLLDSYSGTSINLVNDLIINMNNITPQVHDPNFEIFQHVFHATDGIE